MYTESFNEKNDLDSINASAKKAWNLDSAIHAAQAELTTLQNDQGYWHFELEADCSITADYIIMMHYHGEENDALQEQMATYLRARQTSNGSYSLFTGGVEDLSCSVKVYFALKLAGDKTTSPHMVKLKNYILSQGGAAKANVFTRITLAIFEQIPWRGVPYIPVEIMLLPKWFPFHLDRVSYWSRTVMVPLFILCTLKAKACNPKKINIAELFTTPPHEEKKYFSNDTLLSKIFLGLDKLGLITRPLIPKRLTQKSFDLALTWITERLNGEDGLGGIFPAMVAAHQAMLLLDMPLDHPDVKTAREAMDKLIVFRDQEAYCQPCLSPVWDTGLAALALQEADPKATRHSREKAYNWLKTKQLDQQPGDWQIQQPHLNGGGWAFQFENPHYPDVDDTAVVAFAMANASDLNNLDESIHRATHWTAGMQSKNGGFGAFDCDNTDYYLNHIPFADHGALLDPPTADVSARCAMLLGHQLNSHPEYQKTLDKTITYLRKEQESDGSWFGRWGTNYIYGTWSVLLGLEQTQVPKNDPMYTKAVQWLKSVQNNDGGWGEDNYSYHDDSTRGQAENSTCFQTAWALLGLLAAGEVNSPEVKNGINYILSHQTEEGLWTDPGFTAPGFPKVFYLKYYGYDKFFPLWALARYRNELQKL